MEATLQWATLEWTDGRVTGVVIDGELVTRFPMCPHHAYHATCEGMEIIDLSAGGIVPSGCNVWTLTHKDGRQVSFDL